MENESTAKTTPGIVSMPAPTAWPLVLAFGITTVAAGLLTDVSVTILGGVLAITGVIGWFRAVLPHEAHESLAVAPQVPVIATTRQQVDHIEIAPDVKRAWLPIEIYPISAGIKGGLAGSVVMALLAMTYGLVSRTSIWYPINLLVAGFFPKAVTASTAQLAAFDLNALLIAVPLHLIMSSMVGLLYGAMLPMFPRNPIFLGGFIAPIMWSGLIYSVLDIVNPVLNQRIDWFWFVLSQFGFGLVAGIVVSRQERVRTGQAIPFAVRAGMEASGMRDAPRDRDGLQ
ncbi:MAG: hypothetical protein ABSB35_21390 [Bryobacteraceae bacterium]|jgi:hypothetical protein